MGLIEVLVTPLGWLLRGYHGPKPIPGHGIHRYWFHLYALDEVVPADRDYSGFEELLPLIDGHVIGRTHLEGIQKGK